MTAVPSCTSMNRAAEKRARALRLSRSMRSSPQAMTSSSRLGIAAGGTAAGGNASDSVGDAGGSVDATSVTTGGDGGDGVTGVNPARPSAAGPERRDGGGGGGGGGATGPRPTDLSDADAKATSSASTRLVSSSREPGPPDPDTSGPVNLTKATSRSTLGSGDRRISTKAVPSTSRAWVITAGGASSANRSARSRSAAASCEGGTPMDTRKASLSAPRRASPVTRGSRPRAIPAAKAPRARPGSRSESACSSSSTEVSSSVIPPATTRSRADRASRAEPRPARTA